MTDQKTLDAAARTERVFRRMAARDSAKEAMVEAALAWYHAGPRDHAAAQRLRTAVGTFAAAAEEASR